MDYSSTKNLNPDTDEKFHFAGISEGTMQSEIEFNRELKSIIDNEHLSEDEALQRKRQKRINLFTDELELKEWKQKRTEALNAIKMGKKPQETDEARIFNELGIIKKPKLFISKFGVNYVNAQTNEREFYTGFSGKHVGIERNIMTDEKKLAAACQLLASKGKLKKPHVTEPTPASHLEVEMYYRLVVKGLVNATPAYSLSKITFNNPKYAYVLNEFKNEHLLQAGGIGEEVKGYESVEHSDKALPKDEVKAPVNLFDDNQKYKDALIKLHKALEITDKRSEVITSFLRSDRAESFSNAMSKGKPAFYTMPSAKKAVHAFNNLDDSINKFIETVASLDVKPDGAAEMAKLAKTYIRESDKNIEQKSKVRDIDTFVRSLKNNKNLVSDMKTLKHSVEKNLGIEKNENALSEMIQYGKAFFKLGEAIKNKDLPVLHAEFLDPVNMTNLTKVNMLAVDSVVCIGLKGEPVQSLFYVNSKSEVLRINTVGAEFSDPVMVNMTFEEVVRLAVDIQGSTDPKNLLEKELTLDVPSPNSLELPSDSPVEAFEPSPDEAVDVAATVPDVAADEALPVPEEAVTEPEFVPVFPEMVQVTTNGVKYEDADIYAALEAEHEIEQEQFYEDSLEHKTKAKNKTKSTI